VRVRVCLCERECMSIWSGHMCARTCVCVSVHGVYSSCVCVCMRAARACMHDHTQTHTHAHTHIHTDSRFRRRKECIRSLKRSCADTCKGLLSHRALTNSRTHTKRSTRVRTHTQRPACPTHHRRTHAPSTERLSRKHTFTHIHSHHTHIHTHSETRSC